MEQYPSPLKLLECSTELHAVAVKDMSAEGNGVATSLYKLMLLPLTRRYARLVWSRSLAVHVLFMPGFD